MLKGENLVAEKDRDVIDDVIDGVRRVLEDIDRALRPEKYQKRVPVPVPVRVRPDNPYDPRR
ncbi:MAG: hypothetical protein OHK0046_13300 [Anaerolineae bacterium]